MTPKKAYDFMCGDFVKVKPSGMIIKIAAVHYKKVAYHSTSSRLEWVRQDLLEPIPLTEEILRKNNWCQDMHGEDTLYFIPNKVFYLVKSYQEGYMSIGVLLDGRMLNLFKIQYIHELQHILRLFNIENEKNQFLYKYGVTKKSIIMNCYKCNNLHR